MNIDIQDVITLGDEQEYVVVSKTTYQEKTYYLIVDILHSKTMLCYEDKEELVESKDKDFNTKLYPYLLKESLKSTKN